VEHRIDPKIPPVYTAGTDPAYVPGLTLPRPAEAADPAPGEPTEQPAKDAAPEDAAPEDAAPEDAAPEEATAATAEETAEEADGPVFEVSDHRGSITADRTGVRFRLDDEEAEFGWDEIGAVETGAPRFGRLFTVTVYTTSHHSYEADVQASARDLPKLWTAELDAVLDAYFEETEG